MYSPANVIDMPLQSDDDGVIRVGHTRVTLQTVVDDFHRGASAEEIVHHYPALALPDVYLVVGYYLQHQDEINAYVQEQRELAKQARQDYAAQNPHDPLREKLLSRLNQKTHP